MATVTIAHALFTWRENGDHRIAYHGDVVDIPDDVVDEYTRFGAFAVEPTPEPEPLPTPAAEEPAPADPALLSPPMNTAPKAAWVEYAVAKGYDRDEAEAANKPDLIKALG